MELQEDVLRAMIGKNADHYLEKFKQLERGEKTKFQWSALFIGPAFVLYRKCNELFMKYFAVPCAMAVLSSLSMSVGSGLIFSNMDASFALTALATVLSIVSSVWFLVAGIMLGRKFPKLYLEHLNALMVQEQINDVENNKATIRQFAATDLRIPIAFVIGYIVIIMVFSAVPATVLMNKSLNAEMEPENVHVTATDESVETGGLLDLSPDDLYLQVLDKWWVNETTGDTMYLETSGVSATDGYVYENNAYIGCYSAYGVYGVENPDGTGSDQAFQLDIWIDDNAENSRIYEVKAATAENISLYDVTEGVSYLYYRSDETVGVPSADASVQGADQGMTREEAREYLIQCMYDVYPDFDAREDFAYSYQGEDADCYSFQVLAKNAETTSNNMGYYSVFKISGEVFDDVMMELIWTPDDGLIVSY